MLPTNPPPALVPTHSFSRFVTTWRASHGVGRAVVLALLLGSVLLVCASCTIERVILYNTEQNPSPRATPIAKIEAHG